MTVARDITAIASALQETVDRAQNSAARRIMVNWPSPDSMAEPPEPSDLPVTGWLPEATENAPDATADLVRQIAAISGALRWQQTYSAADLGQSFLDRYGWTLLVGPDMPIACESVLAGVLILGPEVEYPVHKHSAEEIYVILSGAASWKIGDAGWETKPAGGLIHNPPWQAHGMRTDQGQPLLLGFVWNAREAEKSRFSGQGQTEEGAG